MKLMIGIQMACLVAALTVTRATDNQNTNFQELLSGKIVPLTLKFKDLNEDWRRFAASGTVDAGGAAAVYLSMLGRGGGSSSASFYTKGQTITIGSETYLIAYRALMKAVDIPALQLAMSRGGGQPPEPERPTTQTTLALALLNLRTTGNFTDVRPFNLELEMTGSETAVATDEEKRTQETSKASMTNLRKLGTALITYERERKVLPTLTDAKTAQAELELYVANKNVFVHPESKEPYQSNPALSGKRLSDIAKPEKTVVFYEASAATDGTRGVLYLDGHVERVAEAIWSRLKQASQAP